MRLIDLILKSGGKISVDTGAKDILVAILQNDKLTFCKDMVFEGNVSASNLTVTGSATVNNDLNVSGKINFNNVISTSAPTLYINNATKRLNLSDTAMLISYAEASGTVTLGTASRLWGQIYSSKSTISTSDRNFKRNIVPIDERYEQLFARLLPSAYNYVDGDRRHIGFISQDVESAMSEVGLTDMDFGGFCKDVKTKSIVDGETETEVPDLDENGNEQYVYCLRYEEFIALCAHETQRNQSRISALEESVAKQGDEIESLKNMLKNLLEERNDNK